MKSILNPLSSILVFALVVVALGSLAAVAETTTAAAPAEIASGAATTGLESTIIQFAQTHPWVIGLLSFLGALRLLIKPIMTALHCWAAQTETKADDALLDKVEHSWLYTAFLFALDWLASIKVAPKPANAPLNQTLN